MIAFEAPVLAVPSLPELLHWSDQENLLQFELHLTGKAESIYKVLPPEEKSTFAHTTGALGTCQEGSSLISANVEETEAWRSGRFRP